MNNLIERLDAITLANKSEEPCDLTVENIISTRFLMKDYYNNLIATHTESDQNTKFKLDPEIQVVKEWLQKHKVNRK